ncbi:unnamed protein product [Heligmosomoides polygyrus]|uniref:Uncharacterized protein n=1 Tax=Heligmosomoides polygyrus TaxID=6339 RepID=A0A183GRH9_HELPZ|nr:unnamed protein product [Heligmosomoides polygyrus]
MVWMDEVVKSKSKCVHKLRYPVLAEQTMLEETSIGGCVPLVIIRDRLSSRIPLLPIWQISRTTIVDDNPNAKSGGRGIEASRRSE